MDLKLGIGYYIRRRKSRAFTPKFPMPRYAAPLHKKVGAKAQRRKEETALYRVKA